MLKKISIGLGICLALVAGYWTFDVIDQQFRLSNIRFEDSIEPLLPPDANQLIQLKTLLEKPFTYLDRGKQSFVFVSQDKKFVLKFFDARCLKCSDSFFFSEQDGESLERKKDRLFEGYRLAYQHDKDHTGLLYVQLAPTQTHQLQATVYDRFGIKHVIDLNQVPFVVQQKVTTTRRLITTLLQRSNVLAAKQHLRKIVDMYVSEYHRGIADLDHNFMYNTGFVEGKPLRIDVGRLYYDEKIKEYAIFSQDLEKIAIQRLGEWTKRHFPQYRNEILDDMQAKLKEVQAATSALHAEQAAPNKRTSTLINIGLQSR